jgi:hypothetical protein
MVIRAYQVETLRLTGQAHPLPGVAECIGRQSPGFRDASTFREVYPENLQSESRPFR